MAELIMTTNLPDEQELNRIQSALMLGVSPGRVGTLVREKKLTEPITVGALRKYYESKGEKPGKKGKGKGKIYHIILTPEQYSVVSAQADELGFEIYDPRQRQLEREAERMEEAASDLEALEEEIAAAEAAVDARRSNK